jgi:hypothetical protein
VTNTWSLIPNVDGDFALCIMSMPTVRLLQLPVQWVLWVSSQGVKRLEHSADHSPLPIVEIKNVRSHTYAHPYLHDTVLNQLDGKKFVSI